jgi:hypothetical protein
VIPELAVREWSAAHPWPLPSQVEQDLLLSRAICEIANHPYLGGELAFRGGTALHKLHLPEPLRYSEDLDYMRTTAGGIGPSVSVLGKLGRQLGFTAMPLARLPSQVESSWWRGQAEVATLQPTELVATKIRALYRRSKGRDLFDLWLALTRLKLNPGDMLAAFGPYRPEGLNGSRATANPRAKLAPRASETT